MFWRRKPPPPKPWIQRKWNNVKDIIGILTTLGVVATAIVGYVLIDTEPFEKTTDIVSVSANGHLYTSIKTQVVLPEHTYIIISVHGNQLSHQVYPEGLPRKEILIDNKLPFNVVNDRVLHVTVDIVFMGPRTLFQPERLTTSVDVTQENRNAKSNNSNINTNPASKLIWV